MELFTVLSYCLAIAIVVVLLYYYGTRKARALEAAFPGLQGQKPWPFIGNIVSFIKAKGQLHLWLDNNAKKYGRLYSMSFSGVPAIVTTDLDMMKEIFVKKFDCFHDRPSIFSLPEPLNKSVSIISGEDWRRIRKTLSPLFSAHKLKGMTSFMNLACDTLMSKIDQDIEAGKSVDILGYQQGVTMDVIMSTAFGIQANFQSNPNDPVMQTALKAMRPNSIISFIANIVMPLIPWGREFVLSQVGKSIFFKEIFEITDITRKVVDMRRKGQIHKDLLDLMLNATVDNKKLSDDEVIAQSVIFLFAGYETTSVTLAMTCYQLATNPDVQERLQQEIDNVWIGEDQMPSYDTVQELPYLDMVISETMRLCPTVPFVMRECTKDCTVKGLKIPKGSTVLIPVYSLHRDPEYFPDPEKFDPERFRAKESRDQFTFVGFGRGPRNCIGMRFAQMEMKLVLIRLLKKYSFAVAPETNVPLELQFILGLGPKGGMILNVIKRNS